MYDSKVFYSRKQQVALSILYCPCCWFCKRISFSERRMSSTHVTSQVSSSSVFYFLFLDLDLIKTSV